MPKKKLPVRKASVALEADDVVENLSVRPLQLEERERLTAIFADPVFRKAWRNTQLCRPSVVPAGLDTALGAQIGNNRLHQMQGWEMFRTAFLRQAEERRVATPIPQANYPDAGTRDAELAAQLKLSQQTQRT